MSADAGGIRSLIEGRSDYEMVQYGPQYSYFIDEFLARPKFQTQMLSFQLKGEPRFGDLYVQPIPHAGDLITRMYIRVHLPQIPIDPATNKAVSTYATSIGNYLIEYAELLIDKKVIERYYGEFNEMMQEIVFPETKQTIISNTTGKGLVGSSNAMTLYLYLPFSITERGFPLCAMNQGSTELRVKFRESRDFTFPPYLINDIIRAELLFEYIYLSDKEAQYFQSQKRIYLTEQTQLFQGSIRPNVSEESFYLNFTGPTKELFFVIQYDTVGSNVFDFTYSNTIMDHLTSLRFQIDGNDLIPEELGTPLFLRVIQPMDYHTRTPTRTIFYIYSLCIDPENIEPTGTINLGRIQKQFLTVKVVPSAQNRLLRVYTRSYNIFSSDNGVGKLLFNTSGG
jgi:hypothetical protein